MGDCAASSVKKLTSRWYMLSTVEVNTAASSRAGSFTTTLVGRPPLSRWTR